LECEASSLVGAIVPSAALSEFTLVGVLPSLGAFLLFCGSAFHDAAYGAFMTLPPYTCTREGQTRQLGEWSKLPPGGPLS
jgi:hypothetical protein